MNPPLVKLARLIAPRELASIVKRLGASAKKTTKVVTKATAKASKAVAAASKKAVKSDAGELPKSLRQFRRYGFRRSMSGVHVPTDFLPAHARKHPRVKRFLRGVSVGKAVNKRLLSAGVPKNIHLPKR